MREQNKTGSTTASTPAAGDLTPRQAQILGLATAGLSDKEIAVRLGLSHRTVRTHFENLFRTRGLRNRSQAVAMWLGRPSQALRATPPDECPYPKPFPPHFTECPAYQATEFVSLDLSHRPLGSFWTCRHLESLPSPGGDHGFYGACVLGDAEARQRWSDDVGVDRLQEISALRQEVSALSRPYVERLWEVKSRKLSQDVTVPRREINLVVDRLMNEIATRLHQRQALLEHLQLPIDACIRVMRLAIDRFVEEGLSNAESEIPDDVLSQFPDEVRSYFKPGYRRPAVRSKESRRA